MKSLRNLTLLIAASLLCPTAACRRDDDSSRVFLAEVRSADKLVLAQMTISKMATIDDLRLEDADGLKQAVEALGDAVKIGSRKGAYSYDTYMQAYIDMSAFSENDVDIDKESRTISMTLPPVQTELAGRDPGIREDHYRVTGLRSDIDSKERAEIKEKMNTALRAEIDRNPAFRDRLMEQARAKARAYFQSLGEAEGYTVTVDFKN